MYISSDIGIYQTAFDLSVAPFGRVVGGPLSLQVSIKHYLSYGFQ